MGDLPFPSPVNPRPIRSPSPQRPASLPGDHQNAHIRHLLRHAQHGKVRLQPRALGKHLWFYPQIMGNDEKWWECEKNNIGFFSLRQLGMLGWGGTLNSNVHLQAYLILRYASFYTFAHILDALLWVVLLHLHTYLMLRQKMFGKHCDIMRWVISTVWIGTRHPKSIQIRHPKSVFQHETASRLPAVYTQKTMWPNYVTPCPSDGRAFTPSPTVDICTGANKYVYIYIYVCVSYIFIYIYISLSLSPSPSPRV